MTWWIYIALPGLLCALPDGDAPLRQEVDRLAGHRVTLIERAGVLVDYRIDDIAGEGTPLVGRVQMRAGQLYLHTQDGATLRLTGPLARPRIAGPGYKIWVLGDVDTASQQLHARRLGVLAPPALQPK